MKVIFIENHIPIKIQQNRKGYNKMERFLFVTRRGLQHNSENNWDEAFEEEYIIPLDNISYLIRKGQDVSAILKTGEELLLSHAETVFRAERGLELIKQQMKDDSIPCIRISSINELPGDEIPF